MDKAVTGILFALLRSAICGIPLTAQEKELCSGERLPELIAVAKEHDVAHLIAAAVDKNGLNTSKNSEMNDLVLAAVYRYVLLSREFNKICKALEQADISFMPLKGSVIRQYYPEPWMRTSSDLDILVHENELEKAVSCLEETCGYTRGAMGSHDITLYTQNKMHIEIHYKLMEDDVINKEIADVLHTVWDTSTVREGYRQWHVMADEMVCFYHIAHMAKHFELGGCGIRPFIDFWLLEQIENANYDRRKKLLEQTGLLKFANAANTLCRVWFSGEPHTELSIRMERFVVCGGVFGTTESRVAIQQQKQGGRFRYALSRIVLPYDVIKYQYPILQKHRWLTPVMEVRRWGNLVFGGRVGRAIQEFRFNQNISSDEANATKELLKSVGL